MVLVNVLLFADCNAVVGAAGRDAGPGAGYVNSEDTAGDSGRGSEFEAGRFDLLISAWSAPVLAKAVVGVIPDAFAAVVEVLDDI